jgi:prepilin-type N-terminal cleavage/methylation domain-containing protein
MKNRAFPYLSILFQSLPESKGFTLIELLIVLIIVGVFSAISLPMISGKLKGDAQVTEAEMMIGKFAIDHQESVLTGNTIAAPPTSENYTYTTTKIPAGVIVTASHRRDNNQVFAFVKNDGDIKTCRTIQKCR